VNLPDQEKSDIFKPSRFEPLYQPFLGFDCLRGQDVMGSKEIAGKIPGTKITRSCLRQHFRGTSGAGRHLKRKQTVAILVEKTIDQTTKALLFL